MSEGTKNADDLARSIFYMSIAGVSAFMAVVMLFIL
jgi:hypothetical protein